MNNSFTNSCRLLECQDQAEVEYVAKWSVIIERHGGNVVDALTDQVRVVIN